MGKFDLDADYNEVKFRIVEFRTKYPEGSLQPADLTKPYTIETIGGETFIVVAAAAYRTADDARPGIGMAYEVFPGKTPYTKGSELMNAETSAWGRAIVAALAADTSKSVASATEVRNRKEEQKAAAAKPAQPPAEASPADAARDRLRRSCAARGVDLRSVAARFQTEQGEPLKTSDNVDAITALAADIELAEVAA
jgi:hypothetical protein